MADFSYKHLYANVNGKQSTAVHQRPYIPHFHVHADTLGEVFICDSAAGLSLREITVECCESQSFPYTSPLVSLLREWEMYIFSPNPVNSSLPLTMVHSVFCV